MMHWLALVLEFGREVLLLEKEAFAAQDSLGERVRSFPFKAEYFLQDVKTI